MNGLYDVKKGKRGSNQLRKKTRFLSRILMILIYALTSIMYVPAIKVQAAANGTTDGTYDFGGTVGANNSAGVGFATFSDKFVISNGFTVDSGTTQLYTTDLTPGAEGKLIIKTTGGKTFTFKDLGISLYYDLPVLRLAYFNLVLKDTNGNMITQQPYSKFDYLLDNERRITQLSTLFGAQFNIDKVASLEITWKFKDDIESPANLNFENITIANVNAPLMVQNGTINTSNVTSTGVTLGWAKATDGITPQADLEYRVYQSSSNNINTVSSMELNGTPLGSGFTKDLSTFNVTGLSPGTTYYFNVIVRDTGGDKTEYVTNQVTTTSLAAPSVTTNTAVSNLTAFGATVGGNATSDGGAAITERGIVYATTANPTTSNTKVTELGTTGVFTTNLSGLSPNTTYHYRAYATNSVGTSYGSDQTFTTTALSTNADLSNLTLSTGMLTPMFSSGTLGYTSNVGSDVTSVKVTPTVADSKATVKVNGASIESGVASTDIPLSVGATTIYVVVTAEDGSSNKTYNITVNRAAPTYTVTYNGNDSTAGTVPTDSQFYIESDPVTVLGNTGNLVKTGYTFAGWNTKADGSGMDYTENTKFNIGTSNVTLYAQWIPNQYTVTFNSNGGNTINPITANYDTTITAPLNTVRVGYTFIDWYKESGFTNAWNFTTDKVTNDTTLYAKWSPNQYTVSFNEDGGSSVQDQTISYLQKATKPDDPTKTGYTFGGWYEDQAFNTAFDFTNTMITGNTTIYAKWLQNEYKVSFDTNGGSDVSDITAKYNTMISAPTIPVQIGYAFDGWYKESSITNVWDFLSDKITNDTTLYAKWSPNQYTVSFNVDGGSTVVNQTISYLQKATKPDDPTKTGYTFGGWYTDSVFNTPFDFTTKTITDDTTIYAKWIPNDYKVSFDTDGGSFVSDVTTKYNTSITTPITPIKVGYTFSEWYKDSGLINVWDFTTDKVTDNITLYAKWIENQAAITGLMGIAPTSFGGSDGKIIGTTNLMEYKSLGGSTWISVTGIEINGLSAGTYQVRYAAKPGFNAGTITNVIVPAYVFSGGGGSSIPSPTVENITGNIDGGHGTNIAQIPIIRTIGTNGPVKDLVTMSDNLAKDIVEKIKGQGIDIARIVIPDATDKVSETRVDIPQKALLTLNNGKVNLEISTENAVISIPTTSLESVNDDLYFRVVPMKTESERQQVEERANGEQVVQEVAKGLTVQVLGRPMMIETNMSNHPVDLVIPLKGVKIPEQADQRTAFLNNLGVYIEHSDGEKVFTKAQVVPYKNGELGLKFTVTKFSTFTIISIPNTVPTATNVTITGSPKVGSTLRGSYQYKDADQDVEGTSLFTWYRADNAAGKNKRQIASATKSTYKVTSADKGKYISLQVIPVAKTGKSKGVATASSPIGPVKDHTVSKNLSPTVTHLKITGKAIVGRSLKATYTYRDAEKDKQGKSIIQWYRIDPKTKKKSAIKGATKTIYKVTAKDIGKNIVFEVRPIAKTGSKTGKIVTSNKTAIVKRAI